jgi:hypothetical protein
VHAFEQGGALELFDGFKRLRVVRALGLRDLRAVVDQVDGLEATVSCTRNVQRDGIGDSAPGIVPRRDTPSCSSSMTSASGKSASRATS